jgi:predicted transglutaminase-like cysteine proteinase
MLDKGRSIPGSAALAAKGVAVHADRITEVRDLSGGGHKVGG